MNSKKIQDTPELELKEKLMSVSQERLADMLLSLYESNIEMQKQLDIMFAGLEEDPKKIRSMIKKEISSLKRSTKFIYYRESDAFAERLDFIALRIANDLNAKSPRMAFEIMLEFLELHGKILDRCDDSNGSIGGSFMSICEDLGKIASNVTDLSLDEIVEMVFSRIMKDGYGIYGNIIQNFKDALKSEGLSLLQTKLEQVLNDKNRYRIKSGLQAIANCRNNVDDFIEACSFVGEPNLHDHLDIARKLIEHKRGKEALEWLNHEGFSGHNWKDDMRRLKIQALDLEGEHKKAQAERSSWFAENLSPDLYKDILKHIKPDLQESFRLDAIKKAFEFHDPDTALNFLIKIQELEEGAKLVRLKFNEFRGESYYTLRPAADLFKTFDPLAATALYRKMVQPILDKAKYKYYKYAAKDLVACTLLSSEITEWGDMQPHDTYFQDIKADNNRKTSFWSEYNEALRKTIAKQAKLANKKTF